MPSCIFPRPAIANQCVSRSTGEAAKPVFNQFQEIMWIVRLALRRPYTVGVMAFLILMMGIMAIRSMMIDIFPVIDIPVVSVIWTYPGLSAADVEKKIVLLNERGISSSVNGVERI